MTIQIPGVKSVLVSIIAAGSVLSSAQAGDFEFAYKQYELRSTAGVADVHNRLEKSVRNYCTASGLKSVSQKRAEAECHDEMMAEVLEQIGSDRLSRFDQNSTPNARFARN